MRTLKLFAFAAALLMVAAVVVETCDAQGRRGGRGFGFGGRGGGSIVGLLAIEEVRKEIRVEEDVAQKLTDLAEDVQEEVRAEMQDIMADFRDMDQDEQAEAREELAESIAKINADAKKEVGKLLNDKQMARLQQLFVQQQGIRALQNADIAKELKITKEQKEEMAKLQADINEERGEAFREMRDGGSIDREAVREMMAEFQEKSEKGTMDILTKKQKEQFAKMKGKEFKFPERSRRGRGR